VSGRCEVLGDEGIDTSGGELGYVG